MLSQVRRHFSLAQKPLLLGSTKQISEFHRPTDIITHCPSIETRFPFHLSAFLYEHPPNPQMAVDCHNEFRRLLNKSSGARVWTVREVLSMMSFSELRSVLIDFTDINFRVGPGTPSAEVEGKLKRDYIDYSLSNLSKDHLIDLILLHPSLTIDVDNSSTGFRYERLPLAPLANLVFTRDQQITTAKGVVIGRFGASQRLAENSLMEVVWNQLGVKPVGKIEAPGTIEGGDFIPVSEDYAMLGTGLRTNFVAAKQLMDQDLLGTRRFIVVDDPYDKDQQRMHLDTYFNVVSENICVCVDAIARDDPKYIRIAREFVKGDDGKYYEKPSMPFGQWLKKEGFTVVEASFKQQEDYFVNLLHLGKTGSGKDRVFAINPDVEKEIRKAGFSGDVTYLDFSPITAMYGGAHCASQVLRAPQ